MDVGFITAVQGAAFATTGLTAMVAIYFALNRGTPGAPWWLSANAMLALSMHLYALRAHDWFGEQDQSLEFIAVTIWLPGVLLAGTAFVTIRGVRELLDLPGFTRIAVALFAIQCVLHTWLTFGAPSVAWRTFVLAAYLLSMCVWVVFTVLRNGPAHLRLTCYIAAVVYSVFSILYASRVYTLAVELWMGRFTPSLIASKGAFISTAVINILWVFAAILLGQQKRSALNLRQAKIERERERERALNQQREQLSRDLHDTLGGTTATIRLVASTGLRSGTLEAARRALEQVEQFAREANEDVRTLMNHLSRSEFSESEWLSGCRQLAERITVGAGLQLEWDATGMRVERTIGDPAAAIALLRGVKEALHNVVQHAQATCVSIRCTFEEDRLDLLVRDDGRGITDEHTPGRGLLNLRARAEALQGCLTITNSPGARLHFSVPLPLKVEDQVIR